MIIYITTAIAAPSKNKPCKEKRKNYLGLTFQDGESSFQNHQKKQGIGFHSHHQPVKKAKMSESSKHIQREDCRTDNITCNTRSKAAGKGLQNQNYLVSYLFSQL